MSAGCPGGVRRSSRGHTPSRRVWRHEAPARRLAEQGAHEGLTQGVELAAEVVRRHPDCAYAQATLGWNAWLRFIIVGRPNDGYARDQTVAEQGVAACETAIKLDPRLYLGHAAIGGWHTTFGQYDRAVTTLRRSIDLNPSFPTSYNQLISCLTRAGRPRDAAELDRTARSDQPKRRFPWILLLRPGAHLVLPWRRWSCDCERGGVP